MIRLARAPPGTAVESHALGACAVTSPHPWAVIALGRLTGCSLARLPPLLTRCVCSTCCVCSLNHCSLICSWFPFASLLCVDALDPDPHHHLVPNARPSHGPLPDPKQSRKPNARHLHLHLHRRMKNTILTAGFAFFTVLPMYTSFPLATVPSMLGKNFGKSKTPAFNKAQQRASHVTSRRTTLRHATQHRTTPRHATPHHATPHHLPHRSLHYPLHY